MNFLTTAGEVSLMNSHTDLLERAKLCQCGICEACVYAERWAREARRANYRAVPEGATAGRPNIPPAANESAACLEAFDHWVSVNIIGKPGERQLHHMWLAWQGCWVLREPDHSHEGETAVLVAELCPTCGRDMLADK